MYSYLELVPLSDCLHANGLPNLPNLKPAHPDVCLTAVQSKGERKGGEGISL